MWLTKDSLADEIGILAARSTGVVEIPVRQWRVRTRVSLNVLNSFWIVFDVSQPLTSRCEWRVTTCPDPQQTAAPLSVEAGPTAHLDSSLADIQEWLGIGLQQTADAAGISRGTIYAWRDRASSPRAGTVHSILRLHGLVASAVRSVGVVAARSWFHTGDPSPLQQLLDARGDDEVIRHVSRRLRRELTARPLPPVNPWLAANQPDLSE